MSFRESRLLPFVRVQLAEAGWAQLAPPWAYRFAGKQGGAFYAVRRGVCWLEMSEAPFTLVQLAAGDIVAIGPHRSHTLRDSLSTPLPQASQPMPVQRSGPSSLLADRPNDATQILAGWSLGNGPLEGMYPPLTYIPGSNSTEGAVIHRAVDVAEAELAWGEKPGSQDILQRLADIVAIELLRMATRRNDSPSSESPAPFADTAIMRALEAMHKNPGGPWKVASLAREAGLCRSVFVGRFRGALGEAPIQHLTRIRMQKAAEMILHGEHSLAAIAEDVGYSSEAAFHRAFRHHIGLTPGQYRRRPL